MGGTRGFDDDRGRHAAVRDRSGPAPADALHDATLDLLATEDAGEIAGKLAWRGITGHPGRRQLDLGARRRLPRCRGAIGERRSALSRQLPSVRRALALHSTTKTTAPSPPPHRRRRSVTAYLRVTRSLATHGGFNEAERDVLRRLTASAGAAMAGANRLAASQKASRRECARSRAHHRDEPRDHVDARPRPRPPHRRQPREPSSDLRSRRRRALRARRL